MALGSVSRRQLLIYGLGALALVLIGGATTYLVAPPKQTKVQEVVRPAAPESAAAAEMPDVLGLPESIARRAITDAGIGGSVTTRTVPAAGEVGVVVAQTPAAGEKRGEVVLTLSAAAKMPGLAGKDVDVARQQLETLGAVVIVKQKVAPAKPVRSVLATTPAAAGVVPDVVTLLVASPGDALNLSEIDAVDSSGCSTDSDAAIAGTSFTSSVVCDTYGSEPRTATYVLGRRAQLFQATLGLDDDQGTGTATAQVVVDGRTVGTWRLTYGKAVQVSIPVNGAMRITLRATGPEADDPAQVVFGGAAVLGVAAELDGLR